MIGRPTQKHVAEKAGVTQSVVSHVMHGRECTIRVSEATAERVRSVARNLGYQPNVSARNLKRQRTGMIGVLHGDGFPLMKLYDSRYFAALMDGIIDGAFASGYTVGICPQLFSQTPEDAMADGRFDGLVWYSTFPSESNVERLKNCSVPIAIVHSHAAEFDNRFPTAICDNAGGIRLALEHLAELGHRKVGFAYDGEYLFSEWRLRRDAFLQIAPTLGIKPSLIDVRGDRSGLSKYLTLPVTQTAVIGHDEVLAAEVSNGLQAKGYAVPDHVSIVGFDSTHFCDLQSPKLTSISQPISSLGYRAVQMLAEVIDGQSPTPLETILPCGLDVRASTSSVKEALL
ncbi:LacI family transcriptional regulator [bacterium]|nr:MAG: LacI family transcriptional regulator [bacterium]